MSLKENTLSHMAGNSKMLIPVFLSYAYLQEVEYFLIVHFFQREIMSL